MGKNSQWVMALNAQKIKYSNLTKSHALTHEVLHKNAHRLEAVNAAVAAGVSTALAQASGCHSTTLYRWKKRHEELAAAASFNTVLKPGRRGPKIRFPDLEQQ
ncbi:hypothetical protein PF011_g12021 [Phytophthora fragariae]|uniref:HTH psq-type domain-containing protein n=1 Tax=Phytophthora fragariae TaxID=53985 RepID=A0A6A3KIW8_9STRA|nr:hypothetical protein PF011_g12021 [Phytophthora fragariae]